MTAGTQTLFAPIRDTVFHHEVMRVGALQCGKPARWKRHEPFPSSISQTEI